MDILVALPFIGGVMAAGSTGALFPTGSWYDSLSKPGWTPPNWVFPIAWTALYAMIAYVGYRLAVTEHPMVPVALGFWALQMVLNAIWTPVMFGAKRIGTALVIIAFFWVAVLLGTVIFFQVDRFAGWMFLPYLVWVSYASALNLSLWRRNPGAGMAQQEA